MDPFTCLWLRSCYGLPSSSSKPLMSAVNYTKLLAPTRKDLMARAHEANPDAQMSRLIFLALHDLARKAVTKASSDLRVEESAACSAAELPDEEQ